MAGEAHFEIFPEIDSEQEPTGRHRFRLKAANGEIVAVSSESYRDELDAERGAADAARAARAATTHVTPTGGEGSEPVGFSIDARRVTE